MGQTSSLLVNSRAAVGKDNGAPNPSPENTCSSPPTTLQQLPTEILPMISDFLPLSGIMALSYTCRTLRNKMGVSIQTVLGEPNSAPQIPNYAVKPSQERRPQPRASPPERGLSLKRVERLKLLCMLDLDEQLPKTRLSTLLMRQLTIVRISLKSLSNLRTFTGSAWAALDEYGSVRTGSSITPIFKLVPRTFTVVEIMGSL